METDKLAMGKNVNMICWIVLKLMLSNVVRKIISHKLAVVFAFYIVIGSYQLIEYKISIAKQDCC